MNLKEAFTYQNKLKDLMENALIVIGTRSNHTTTTEYFKDDSPENATVVDYGSSDIGKYFSNKTEELITFANYILQEKISLNKEIRDAKRYLPVDVDTATNENRTRQTFLLSLAALTSTYPSEAVIKEGGKRKGFNSDGNPIEYDVDIVRITTLNYSKEFVEQFAEELSETIETNSCEIDKALINTTVDFEPTFKKNDNLVKAFERWKSMTA